MTSQTSKVLMCTKCGARWLKEEPPCACGTHRVVNGDLVLSSFDAFFIKITMLELMGDPECRVRDEELLGLVAACCRELQKRGYGDDHIELVRRRVQELRHG